jgi:serine/threonine protein phosphatase 1
MKTFVIGDVHGRCAQLLNLLDMIPRDESSDTLVFLGDLIDRGPDAPGCVDHVRQLVLDNPERVTCLRGNHEQMLLDFIEGTGTIWITPVTGGERTFEQYAGQSLMITSEADIDEARRTIQEKVPPEHLKFFRQRPFYHEDEYAFYVHAGLDHGKHPRETAPQLLLWSRISTRTIAANHVSLAIHQRPFCHCADEWGGTASTFSTVPSGSTQATTRALL